MDLLSIFTRSQASLNRFSLGPFHCIADSLDYKNYSISSTQIIAGTGSDGVHRFFVGFFMNFSDTKSSLFCLFLSISLALTIKRYVPESLQLTNS